MINERIYEKHESAYEAGYLVIMGYVRQHSNDSHAHRTLIAEVAMEAAKHLAIYHTALIKIDTDVDTYTSIALAEDFIYSTNLLIDKIETWLNTQFI